MSDDTNPGTAYALSGEQLSHRVALSDTLTAPFILIGGAAQARMFGTVRLVWDHLRKLKYGRDHDTIWANANLVHFVTTVCAFHF
jgi:hypothetical protein